MCLYIVCVVFQPVVFSPAGMILHFKLPHLVDYYIIDPQRWFDLCALVISPDNVSKLIRSAGFMARGQMVCMSVHVHVYTGPVCDLGRGSDTCTYNKCM